MLAVLIVVNVVPGSKIRPNGCKTPKFSSRRLWRRDIALCQPPPVLASFIVWSGHVRSIFQNSLQVPEEPMFDDLKANLWLPGARWRSGFGAGCNGCNGHVTAV